MSSMTQKTKTTIVGFRLDADRARELKVHAAERGATVQALLERAVTKMLRGGK